MKKQRSLYIVLMVLLLILSVMAAVACTDPKLDETATEAESAPTVTYDQTVANGTFYSSYNKTGKNYLKTTVDSWTATKGQTAVSSATFGAIDMTEDLWTAGIGTLATGLAYPGIAPNSPRKADGALQDSYAAVVAYTKDVGSAYYLSSSVTAEKGKTYKLTVDVATFVLDSEGNTLNRTQTESDGKGAYIFVAGGLYNVTEAINTEGGWDTITIYLEPRSDVDATFTVQLWLGHGSSYVNNGKTNTRLTRGVMLFDNVILSECTSAEYAAAIVSDGGDETSYVSGGTVHKHSIKYFDDTDFSYNTAYTNYSTSQTASSTKAYYSAKVGTPNKYTRVMGEDGLTSDYPTTYTNSYYYPDGIFDLSKIYTYSSTDNTFKDTFADINTSEWAAPNWEDFYSKNGTYTNSAYNEIASSLKQSDNNTRVLAIYNKNYSGLGFKSNSKMLAEAGKYYSVTTYAYLYKALLLPNTATTGLTLDQVNANVEALNSFISEDVTAKIKLTGVTFSNDASYGTGEATLDTSTLFGASDLGTSVDALAFYETYDDNGTTKYKLRISYSYIVNEAFGAYSVSQKLNSTEYAALSSEEKAKCSQYDTEQSYVDYYGKWVTALGSWQELTFKFKANSLSSRAIGIEFWLGEGSSESSYPDLQKGGVFFDGINILESDSDNEAFDVLSAASQAEPFKEISAIDITGSDYDLYKMTSAIAFPNIDSNAGALYDELTTDNQADADSINAHYGYLFKYVEGINNTSNAAFAAVISPEVDSAAWAGNSVLSAIGAYPEMPSVYDSSMGTEYTYSTLVLQHKNYTASTLTLNDVNSAGYEKLAKIYANKYYRLGVMVKTENLSDNATATLELIRRNTVADKAAATSLSSFTSISTDGAWTEYVFYISGALLADTRDENGNLLDYNRVGLSLSFGSGDAYNSSTHTKGTIYLSGINFATVAYSEYNNAIAGDTLKKYGFTASTFTSNSTTNGRFTNVDFDDTMTATAKTKVGTIDLDARTFNVGGRTFTFNAALADTSTSDAAWTINREKNTISFTYNPGYVAEFSIKNGEIFASTAYDEQGNMIVIGAPSDGWSTTAYTYDKLTTPAVENKTVFEMDGSTETKAVSAFTIRWKAVVGAVSYEVYYNKDADADNKFRVLKAAPVPATALYEGASDGYVYYRLPDKNAGTYYVRAIPADLSLKKVSEFGSVTVNDKTEIVTMMKVGQGYSATVFAAAPVASTAGKYDDTGKTAGPITTDGSVSYGKTAFNGTVADSDYITWAKPVIPAGQEARYEIYYQANAATFDAANAILIYTYTPTIRATVADVTADDKFVIVGDSALFYKLPSAKMGYYFVRVVPNTASSTYEGKVLNTTGAYMDANFFLEPVDQNSADWAAAARTSHDAGFAENSVAEDLTSFRGIIDFKHFNALVAGMGEVADNTYLNSLSTELYSSTTSAGGAPSNGFFTFGRSTNNLYNNTMMLYSDVATYGGYTMSSTQTLTAGSFYYVSVWVLTKPGTKASISLDNSGKVYDNSNDFDGYYDIDTNGKWVEYRFLAKVGVTSATIKLGLFMGRKYVVGTTTEYDYQKGYVFFDDITLKTIDETVYEAFVNKNDGTALTEWTAANATTVIAYNEVADEALDTIHFNNSFAFVALDYVTDSFDTAGTTLSTSDTALGYTPSDYTHGMATSSVNDTDARSYGVYNATELSEEKHEVFYSLLAGESWFSGTISNLESAKNYLTGWGKNSLMMVNYVDNGQYYQSNTRTLDADGYYIISFYAKALLPEGKYAEFRFVHGDDTTKYDVINIYGGGDQGNGFAKYNMYVSNPTASSVSASYFTFNLGTYDSTTETKAFTKGMLVVDNVTMKKITETEYTAGKAAYDTTAEANKATSRLGYYAFTTANTEDTETEDPETEDAESNVDPQTWLIISSAVIGAMILIAVVVVMIRQFKKKYVKTKVVGDNKLDSGKKDELAIKQQHSTAYIRENVDRDEFED